jgi:hypothetical protein
MSEQRFFAGFWRDGAVVVPEKRHYGDDVCVFVVRKEDGSREFCHEDFKYWHMVYWLDMTTPTEVTPQEAFELLRIVYPTLPHIRQVSDLPLQMVLHFPAIKWDDATLYPHKWRVPTDADKFRKCRVKANRDETQWTDGYIFMTTDGDGFLVKHDGGYITPVALCEVLE